MADLLERDALLSEIDEEIYFYDDSKHKDDKFIALGMKIARKLVKKHPAVNRWIPCSERFPNHYDDILFCERDRTIHKGFMYWDGTFIENHVKFRNGDIVAWMPMPEPPEKE